MKKLILVLALFLIAVPAFAQDALTTGEIKTVKSQIQSNWNLNPGEISKVVVEIRVTVAQDGTVIEMPQIEDKSRMSDPVYRSIAYSARRAILLSSPLRLPASKYETWSGEGGLFLRFSIQGIQ